ncbi:aminopeptidase N [Lentilitoribacter sp. Alg239-R112]|uniref:aminopeptidase N n=1 Tax=Lentilitoribacter sp. Alg239-R112 TaxID=2305987 RepID=UPI0013A6E867|nr:aminopeptidase N [Lentilitoribacter sp. Alg239-R112]
MRSNTGQVLYLKDYQATDFVLERTDLTFELHPTETKLITRTLVHRREGAATDAPMIWAGDELNVESVQVDSVDVTAENHDISPDELVLKDLPESVAFEVTVTTILSPETNTQLMGLYRTSGIYCTQCEAEGFRRMTYFYDRPDAMCVYTVTIIADKEDTPVLLSNGNFLGGGGYDEGRHFAAWFDPHPKPSYLFALVGGDLGLIEDTFTTMSGKEVALKIYTEHGKEPRAAYAMDALKRSMKWDEEKFGREYDLDIFQIVAVSDFNMGAMENKGLNVFNDKYVLADPETATDADYAGIERVIAHEYFHNWTGNRITCRDWFQLCLKEGLTVYRDHEFSADERSRPVTRIDEIRTLKLIQYPEDAGPLAHPVRPGSFKEINNFYTATVYEKGSEVCRMIRTIVGAEDFRKGMDLYFERHDGDAATIEDFVAVFAEVSGRDFTQFSLWYDQAGTPSVTVNTKWDESASSFTVTLEQTLAPTPGQPDKKVMHIPLSYTLIGTDGENYTIAPDGSDDTHVLHLTERSQTFTFSGLKSKPVLSINRGLSAPVNIHMQQSEDDLAHISANDSDAVGRWQALQNLAMIELITGTKAIEDGGEIGDADLLIGAYKAIMENNDLEQAFVAQALQLPIEADIAREFGDNINPDSIRTAIDQLKAKIAAALVENFEALHKATQSDEKYDPSASHAGRRALSGVTLEYLSVHDGNGARAYEAYKSANNMTQRSTALVTLTNDYPTSSDAQAALADFKSRYSDNPLVMDKWLAIQARMPGDAALDHVKTLMSDDVYDANNPNRIRSLIGTFAAGNATGFNRPDGGGYQLLAEQVLELDGKNPQVAARLLTAMRSWRSLEPVRRDAAKTALEKIAAQENLSADVSDIVERTLAA